MENISHANCYIQSHSFGYSSEISPTRCNNCVFILRNGFNLHVSGDNLTHHQEYICCIWATGKPAQLGCKFLSDVSVVNSPIVVDLLIITALFCVVLPAGSTGHISLPKSYLGICNFLKKMPRMILNTCQSFSTDTALLNDQHDAQFFCFIIRLLQSSTCFEQRRAHHQEVILY